MSHGGAQSKTAALEPHSFCNGLSSEPPQPAHCHTAHFAQLILICTESARRPECDTAVAGTLPSASHIITNRHWQRRVLLQICCTGPLLFARASVGPSRCWIEREGSLLFPLNIVQAKREITMTGNDKTTAIHVYVPLFQQSRKPYKKYQEAQDASPRCVAAGILCVSNIAI